MKGFVLSVFVFCAIIAAGKFTALFYWVLMNLQILGATICTSERRSFVAAGVVIKTKCNRISEEQSRCSALMNIKPYLEFNLIRDHNRASKKESSRCIVAIEPDQTVACCLRLKKKK